MNAIERTAVLEQLRTQRSKEESESGHISEMVAILLSLLAMVAIACVLVHLISPKLKPATQEEIRVAAEAKRVEEYAQLRRNLEAFRNEPPSGQMFWLRHMEPRSRVVYLGSVPETRRALLFRQFTEIEQADMEQIAAEIIYEREHTSPQPARTTAVGK